MGKKDKKDKKDKKNRKDKKDKVKKSKQGKAEPSQVETPDLKIPESDMVYRLHGNETQSHE